MCPPPRTLEAAEGLRYPPVVLVLLYPLMISFYYILLLYPHVILLLSYPLVCCSPLSIRFPFDSLLLSPFFHLHLLLLLHFQPLSHLFSHLLLTEPQNCRCWGRGTLARFGKPRWTTSAATREPSLSPSKGLRQVCNL